MKMTSEYTIIKDNDLGLYAATLDIQLPPISVTRFKADKSDFKYEMRRAVSEIVEEIVEKVIEEY